MRISTAFLFLLLSLLVLKSMKAQDSIGVLIDEMVIAENRIAIPFSDASRNIAILRKKDIEQINAQSINELLQVIGGVDIRQRGVHGVQADLSIRGGTFEQSLVLLNGVKLLDPQTGHHLMNIPVTMEDIERIEVLKGPGARVYGQNAFAGAINIVTKTNSSTGLKAGVTAGSNDLLSVFATADIPVKQYEQKVSVSLDKSSGYRDNTDYDIYNAFYQGRAGFGSGQLDILAGYTSRNFGANGFYGNESFTDQYEETRTSLVSASYTAKSGDWKLIPRISWRRNTDNWQFRRTDPEFFQNFHTSHVVTSEFNTSKIHPLGMLGIGIEHNIIHLRSNNLGDRNRNQIGFHLENRFVLSDERIDITPGIYGLHISDYGMQVFPGIDAGFRINNEWKLFSNIGWTSRIPSFTDLYYEDRGNIGNPELEMESAFTFELGTSYKSGKAVFQLSYFRRNATDLIDWFKVNPDDKWMPDNFGTAVYNGIDLSSTWDLSNSRAKSFLQTLRINYLYLDASLGQNEFSLSRNALENLRHQLIINPRFNLFNRLSFHILMKYNDRVSLEDYLVMDAQLSMDIQKVELILKVNNFFDSQYRETNLVPMPGRWLMAGIKYRI